MYLLKFSGCLFVFWLVYVVFLERQKMHHFKRFYLLAAFAMALTIPLLSITEYIEPVPVINFNDYYVASETAIDLPTELPKTTTSYLPILLWSIYGLGVALLLMRFVVNLVKLYRKILNNETLTKGHFIYVLLNSYRIPHSFFKYIFLNKASYKTNTIPKEVLLHEETHAKQLHSIDILIVELLQMVFWFHPLIYILKHHIKLNHEFLADQAVLDHGTNTKNYQTIVLQFSSGTPQSQLVSAFNYSSIKKRLTVMNTQTSKTRVWLSSLLLLPIIGLLFYSFAERNYVEKENTSEISNLNESHATSNLFLTTVEKDNNTISLKCESGCKWSHLTLEPNSEGYIINDYGFSEGKTLDTDAFAFAIQSTNNGIKLKGLSGTTWESLNIVLPEHQKQAFNQLGLTALSNRVTEKALKHKTLTMKAVNNTLYIGDKKSSLKNYVEDLNAITENWTLKDYEITNLDLKTEHCSKTFLNSLNELHKKTNHFKVTVLGVNEATPAMIKEYNDWIIAFNTKHIVDYTSYQRIVAIYELMTPKQRQSVERYPVIPSINLTDVTPKSPTKTEFESWKNAQQFAIWINGKHVPNSTLNNYTEKDIIHFVGSKVYENARSKTFPQPYQYSLYTKEGFKTEYQESRINTYRRLSNTYSEAINSYLKGPQTDNSELLILGKQVENMYKSFSKEDKTKHKLLPPPPVPMAKKSNDWKAVENLLKPKSKGEPNANNSINYPIPPPIPENASPAERAKMQKAIDDFEKKYKRKVHTVKLNDTGEFINLIVNDEVYEYDSKKQTPKTKTGFINVNGQTLYFTKINNQITYYNRYGIKTDKNGKELTPAQQTNADDVLPNTIVTKVYQNDKVVSEFNTEGLDLEQQKATKAQVAEYNTWAKKMNTAIKKAKADTSYEYPIIKQKDVEHYIHIYKNVMTDEQRKKAEPLPNIPPPPKAKKG